MTNFHLTMITLIAFCLWQYKFIKSYYKEMRKAERELATVLINKGY